MTYRKRTLIAVDQLLNTLLGGWPDETLSALLPLGAGRGEAWPRRVVDGLFFWQREHCKSSYESEREGRQSPPELRTHVRPKNSTPPENS
ncbi:MAG: pseudouridine synthase [Bilophila wadsworthia]